MTRKEQSCLMWVIFIIIIAVIASACGAPWHLKKRDYHERKAIEKGAKISADTVYQPVQVFVPQVKTDTVFSSLEGDTVRIEKEKLKIKYVNLPKDSVFISGECEADTVIQKVPVTVTKKISAGYTKWELIGTCIAVAAVSILAGMFVQGMRK